MEVLRHHNVSGDPEVILCPNFFQNPEKEIAPFGGTKEGLSSVAAAGDEMPVTTAMNTP